MNKQEKVTCLKEYLEMQVETFADSFKGEIAIYLGGFDVANPNLTFLNSLSTEQEIHDLIDRLTSRIVMKYDEEVESLGDFVFYWLERIDSFK